LSSFVPSGAQLALRVDETIQRLACHAQLLAQVADRAVALAMAAWARRSLAGVIV